MRYLCLILLMFLSCGLNPGPHVVSTDSRASSCGGFSTLAKNAMIPYTNDSLEYCKSEKLIWFYSSTDKKLEILHLRNYENCAAQLELYVEEKNGKYEIQQKDNRDPQVSALCSCVFDTYCAIPNVQKDSLVIVYKGLVDTLYLTHGTGVVMIDTSSFCGHYPFL